MENKKVLIVKMSSIGDVIHTMIPIAILKREKPNYFISWVVKEHIYKILTFFPYVDEIIKLKKNENISKLIKNLRKKDFDITIDFQGLIKSGIITFLSGAKLKIGFDKKNTRESLASLFYNQKIDVEDKKHVIEKSISLLNPLGIKNKEIKNIDFKFPETLKRKVEKIILNNFYNKKFIILNPGGMWHTKRWPTERFGELAKLIKENFNYEIAIIFGKNEKKYGEEIKKIASFVKLIPLELDELFYFISKCEIYVGGDTGPTHMASILNKKCLALFGPTDPERNGPFNENSKIVYEKVYCSPCYKRKCKNPICMDIAVKDVYEKFKELVET